jgi:acyl-CoA synthetase (NDP forming)
MFGLGGIYAEALGDVAFRVAPLTREHALDMQEELRGRALLDPQRGGPAADRAALADLLVALGRLGLEEPGIREIDLNPLKLTAAGTPLAVDALVVWEA